jgi:hypothetical protein
MSMEQGGLAEEAASPVEMCEIVLKEEVGEDVITEPGIFKESESCQVFIKEEVKEEHVEESFESVESVGGEDPLIR